MKRKFESLESVPDLKSPETMLKNNEIYSQTAQEMMDMLSVASSMIKASLISADVVRVDPKATLSQRLAAIKSLQQGARLQVEAARVAVDLQKAFKVETKSAPTTHLPPEIGTDEPEV